MALGLEKAPDHLDRAIEGTTQVSTDCPLPLLGGDVEQRRRRDGPRIINDNLECSKSVSDLVCEAPYLVGIADIEQAAISFRSC
jgi:hypothetical protein